MGRHLIAAALGALFCASGIAQSTAAESSPNFLFIIADDMGCHDCGPYGNQQIRTPHLDRLARQGMTFNRAFTATAMCAPTRQQLYTGVFPVRNGAYPNHSRVKRGTRSLVHHLQELGYRVGLVGKRHFGPTQSFPFEFLTPQLLPEFVTRKADQPFCLVVASNHPHAPWTEGPGDYNEEKLQLPEGFVDTPETRAAYAAYCSEVTAFDDEVGESLELLRQNNLEKDTVVIATSEQGPQFPAGKWTCYEYGLQVALIIRWPHQIQAGSRTDAMVQYVDIAPTVVELAGGTPSKIDTGLMNASDGGRGFDGRSFCEVLRGTTDKHNDWVFGIHTTRGIIAGSDYPIRSIRDGRYKYIRNLNSESTFNNIVTEKDQETFWRSWEREAKQNPMAAKFVSRYLKRPAEELYDLQTDPWEMTNLANSPEQQARIKQMGRRLDAWMQQQGDRGMTTEGEATLHRSRKRRKQATADERN